MNAICETCRYWHPEGTGHFGNRSRLILDSRHQIWAHPCRRLPRHEPRWYDDWCGEYAPCDSGSGPEGENSRSEVEGEAPQSGLSDSEGIAQVIVIPPIEEVAKP